MKADSGAIKVHLPRDLYEEVERVASEEQRSLSNVLRRVVTQWSAQRRQRDQQQVAA